MLTRLGAWITNVFGKTEPIDSSAWNAASHVDISISDFSNRWNRYALEISNADSVNDSRATENQTLILHVSDFNNDWNKLALREAAKSKADSNAVWKK